MLKKISKEFSFGHSEAKKLCAKLKSSRKCHRTPGSRRKRKTSERSDRFIVSKSKLGAPTEKQPTRDLEAQTGVKVLSKTIQRRLREKGIHWRKKSKKPFLSDKNCRKHLAFAKEHADWDLEDWKRVIWSNESPFTSENSSSQIVWRTNDEKTASRSMRGRIEHQKSINDLHPVKEIMTGEVYREILIYHFVPSAHRLSPDNFIIQQDNDQEHTRAVV